MNAALLTDPLILALQLGLLYLLGSYATSALGSAGAATGTPLGSFTGRLLFYLLVAPGVILHESAHYLACKLTGTPVGRFVPFAPRKDASGGTTLGYVQHGARNPLTSSVIGLAPVVVNPLALLVLTLAMTPLDPLGYSVESLGSLSSSGVIQIVGGIGEQALAFFSKTPLLAVLWIYLSLSLCLGSVPSRADLVAVPGALVLVAAAGFVYSSVAGNGFLWSLSSVAAHASALYLFPLIVAAVAAGAGALLVRR
jgi:hypothetical protein